eukprot:COSAG05_NODE_176_length_14928_cov_75.109717_11_plen_293_part_00
MVLPALAVLALTRATAPPPVGLIIDTDIGGGGCQDVDDVVAVCIANALADNGEAALLAVVQNTAPVECAGAISALNHFYGRDVVSVGAYNINTPGATLQQQQPLPYVKELVQKFDGPIRNSTQAEDAVAVYRRTLAAQPDRSVAISSIGIHTNLAALLQSAPDFHSPLGGRELVARKVRLLAVMGGRYPKGGLSCNLKGGGAVARARLHRQPHGLGAQPLHRRCGERLCCGALAAGIEDHLERGGGGGAGEERRPRLPAVQGRDRPQPLRGERLLPLRRHLPTARALRCIGV